MFYRVTPRRLSHETNSGLGEPYSTSPDYLKSVLWIKLVNFFDKIGPKNPEKMQKKTKWLILPYGVCLMSQNQNAKRSYKTSFTE